MAQSIVVRNVRFPIKFKLISVIALLLLASLTLYSYYALTHFKKDKSAYIYGSTLTHVESNGSYINTVLTDSLDGMYLILNTFLKVKNEELLSNIFESNKQLIELQIYNQNKKLVYGIADKNLLSENSLKESFFLDLIKSRPLDLNEISKPLISTFPIKELPHLLIQVYKENHYIFARVKLSNIIDLFNNDKQHESFVYNDLNQIIAHSNFENILRGEKFDIETFDKISKSSSRSGVYRYTKDNITRILSYYKIPELSLNVLSEIPEHKAYEAANYLIDKSVYFGVFLLSIAIIVGILFSKNLTTPIETLFDGSKEIAAGNFKTKVNISSSDEIGALTDSFNFMSDEILRYMDEMKEKLRLEKEVEVAKLVQDAFFPNDSVVLDHLDIAAIHETASECGGDWWGYIDTNEQSVIMIADATGHGVPAALLTASANCSLAMIEEISINDPDILKSPSKMLQIINKAVCHVGSQVLMTFFIISIDKKNNKMTYANASHNPPILYVKSENTPDKKDLHPLMSTPGARVGHELNPEYEEKQSSYKPEDVLVLFTDGIIEGVNQDDKPWGNRRFFKAILGSVERSASDIRDHIVNEAKSFFAGVPVDDDLTLVTLKFKSKNSSKIKEVNDEIKLTKIHNQTVAISKLDDKENILTLLEEKDISHIIGDNSPTLDKDLKILEEVLNNNGLWNHTLYNPIDLQTLKISTNENLQQVIDEITNKINYEKFFSSPINYIQIVTNELLTNALYNATGTSSRVAGQIIKLENEKSIELNISNYENGIIINVRDTVGNLTKEQIKKALARSAKEQTPEQKEGGAGLGLFTIFNYANQIIFNLDPGKATEVTCIFENNKRYKNYRKRITSLHIHEIKGNS